MMFDEINFESHQFKEEIFFTDFREIDYTTNKALHFGR